MKLKELTIVLSPQPKLREAAATSYRKKYPKGKLYRFPSRQDIDPHEPFLAALADFLVSPLRRGVWCDSWLTLAVDLSLKHRVKSDIVGHTQILSRLQDAVDSQQIRVKFWVLPADNFYAETFANCSPWWQTSLLAAQQRYELAWLTYVNEQIPYLGEILNADFIHQTNL